MRSAPLVRAWWPVAVSAWLVGCGFDPQPQSGSVACKPEGTACCPEGYVCVGRGVATTGGPAAGSCWNKRDLPRAALALAHDSTPTIPNDPVCLVTDWLPSATEPDADVPAILADAASTPTGTGGSGGGFPDAPSGPEASTSPDTADAPIASGPGDVLDSSAERSPEVAGERPGVDGAADNTLDGPNPDAAGRLDTPADLPRADVAPDTRLNSGGVVTSIAAGGDHTCAVVDGTVWCWGDNNLGQLGDGTKTTKYVPVQVPGLEPGAATGVAASYGHSCALVNGGVKCWGYNVDGQLGNGTTSSSDVPVSVVGLESGVTAIVTASNLSCAVVNGGMQCWGEGLGDGRSIDNYSKVPVAPGGLTSGVTAIATDGYKTCAVVNGGLFCWSSWWQLPDKTMGWQKPPEVVAGLEQGVTAAAVGSGTVCAVVDGAVKCWGDGSDGQLGDGTTTSSGVPVQVPGLTDGATAVSVSNRNVRVFACALVVGGVSCWGDNFEYQLGDGSGGEFCKPSRAVGLVGITLLSAGYSHACASTGIGLSCWGDNSSGTAGAGQGVSLVQTPRPVGFP